MLNITISTAHLSPELLTAIGAVLTGLAAVITASRK